MSILWLNKGSITFLFILYSSRKKELFHALSHSEAFSITWKGNAGKLFKFDVWILKMLQVEDYLKKETVPFVLFSVLGFPWASKYLSLNLSVILIPRKMFASQSFWFLVSVKLCSPKIYSTARTSVLACPCVGEPNKLSLDFKLQAYISVVLKEIFDETLDKLDWVWIFLVTFVLLFLKLKEEEDLILMIV